MRHFELLEKQLLRLTGGGNSRYLYRLIIFEANAAHTRKRAAA